MNYDEALSYVIQSYGPGRKHDRAVLAAVLALMGDPQDKIRTIHVAGTNGKGSFCAMTAKIFELAGYKTGFFSSPHLIRFNERMRINGCDISDSDFARHIERVKNVTESVLGIGGGLSYFELLTAAAFSWFEESGVDIALIETGLGGRLDSTNLIKRPEMSVICSISLDHMEFLGNTLERIAREKAGIIKKNCPVVLYSQDEVVYNVVRHAAAYVNAPFYCEPADIRILDSDKVPDVRNRFSIHTSRFSYDEVRLSLDGEYQVLNAALCLQAMSVFNERQAEKGLPAISGETILRGLRETEWHGRFEQINDTIILDGAHNIDAVNALCRSVKLRFSHRTISVVVGIMKDKSCREMVNALNECADVMVYTMPLYRSRAISPSELYRMTDNKHKTLITESDPIRAVELAKKISGSGGLVVVCGSLYLVGDIKKHFSS